MTATKERDRSPKERLERMRRMFAADGMILADDYRFFTKQDEPKCRNKAARRLGKQHGRPAPKRS